MIPLLLEIVVCFVLATLLLNRYSDIVNSNIITLTGVFIGWFFSFLVIFLLPVDLTSTAYRQCLLNQHTNSTSNTTFYANNSSPQFNLLPTPSQLVNGTLIPPIDNNQTSQTNGSAFIEPCSEPWNFVSDHTLIKLWRFIYWSCQLLTWLVLPIMQSYSMNGEFSTIEKLRAAVRANLIYYSSLGAIFLILLFYVIIRDGLDLANLKVIIISSSNTWGLFLLVILLGYGLVELPRSVINRSKYTPALNQQYFKVAKVNAEKCEAEESLDDVIEEILRMYNAVSTYDVASPLKRYLDQIVAKCPPGWKRRSNAFKRTVPSNSPYGQDSARSQVCDMKSLIQLHKKVIKVVHRHRQVNCKWNQLITDVIEWDDVAKNQGDKRTPLIQRSFKSSLPRKRLFIHSIYTPTVEWIWRCLVKIWLLKIIGFAMAALSLAVVWSEIAFPITIFSSNFSIFAYFVNSFQAAQKYFYLEIFSTISIGYLAMCAFYTVFHMRIYNVYYLAPNSQTDEYSLVFSGMLVCRLAAPLCLNYLCLVQRDSHILKRSLSLETSFTTIMGHLDLIPIINGGLNVFLPLFISVLCLAIYFDFGTHILHKLGFDQFIENDELTLDWVQTGRQLVDREKGKLLRSYAPTTSAYQEMVEPNSLPADATTSTDIRALRQSQSYGANISPTSSSSSGFSGSSLLPKSSRRAETQEVSPQHPRFNYLQSRPSQQSNDTLIEIETHKQADANPRKPDGFFDDV